MGVIAFILIVALIGLVIWLIFGVWLDDIIL